MFEHAPDLCLIHDADGQFIRANRRACEALGYAEHEFVGMLWTDIDTGVDLSEAGAAWSGLGPGEISTFRRRFRRRDGSSFPVEIRLTGLREENELRLIVLARDVSEQQESEAALLAARKEIDAAKEANRRQAMLIANSNHELRTPMHAVVGMTDLLLETLVTRKQQSYLQSIRSSGDALLTIIDDMLDFSVLEAGQLCLEKKIFTVDDVLDPVFAMLGRNAYSKGIELACLWHSGPKHALGDPDRVRQVLLNLVGNAVKFTDHGEVIVEVSLESDSDEKDWLQFVVTDTGVGIDQSKKEDMFLPFSRFGSSAIEMYGGTGLGLAICKRLVGLIGGSIDITARSGGGTSAWFRVPASNSSGKDLDTLPEGFVGTRALVVDDNPIIGKATCSLISSLGIQPDLETDAEVALTRLLDQATLNPYRIAIVDADMPGINCVAMATRIRSQPLIEPIELILLTSLTQFLQPGVASSLELRCLDKPIRRRPLRDTLEEILSPHRGPPDQTVQEQVLNLASSSRILVADDDALSRRIFSDMALVLGVEVDVVEDGLEALQAISAKSYGLILLDCQMPGMDGCAVATEIRNTFDEDDRPVIVAITASASAAHRAHCFGAGMDDYMPKPVTLKVLREALKRWLPQERLLATVTESGELPAINKTGPMGPWRVPRDRGDFSSELVELFIDDSEQRLIALSRMLESGSKEETRDIAREAHALKSGCLYIEADHMAALSGQLEETVNGGALEPATEILAHLCTEFDDFRQQHEVISEHL